MRIVPKTNNKLLSAVEKCLDVGRLSDHMFEISSLRSWVACRCKSSAHRCWSRLQQPGLSWVPRVPSLLHSGTDVRRSCRAVVQGSLRAQGQLTTSYRHRGFNDNSGKLNQFFIFQKTSPSLSNHTFSMFINFCAKKGMFVLVGHHPC